MHELKMPLAGCSIRFTLEVAAVAAAAVAAAKLHTAVLFSGRM